MLTYTIRRILQGIGVMLLSSFVLYTLIVYLIPGRPGMFGGISAVPGAPYQEYKLLVSDMGRQSTGGQALSVLDKQRQARIQDLSTTYKFDRPWPVSYLAWLFDPSDTTEYDSNFNVVPKGIDIAIGNFHLKGSGVLTGHLGRSDSVATGLPVGDLIASRWFNSFVLILATVVLSLVVALPLGVIAASRQHSFLDRVLTVFSFGGLSIPPFFLGLMLIIFLGVIPHQLHVNGGVTWLPYLPVGDATDPGQEGDWVNRAYHLVLPVLTLVILQVAVLSRYVRFAMLEVMKKNYVRTAYAKGLSRRRVLYRHALRNALLPLITAFTLTVPTLLTGAIVIETVFNYLGLGQLFFMAVGGVRPAFSFNAGPLDNQLALVLMVIMTAVVVFFNLLADVLYAVADPRVNYAGHTRA